MSRQEITDDAILRIIINRFVKYGSILCLGASIVIYITRPQLAFVWLPLLIIGVALTWLFFKGKNND